VTAAADGIPEEPLQRLYSTLRDRLGDYVAADELAHDANLPPSSIAPDLRTLEKGGVPIEHHPAIGIRLTQIPDDLICWEIQHQLATRSFGRPVFVHRELDSTNDSARSLVDRTAAEGTLVVTECQRAGRGRRGRSWHSPAGVGLWCSLVIYPDPTTPLGFITLLLGVAIARAIRLHCGLDIRLKWPNDIMLAERKAGGILCERHGVEPRPALIAGFGINVNQTDFPAELRPKATSLAEHAGQSFDRAALLKRILYELEQDYICAASGGEDLITDQARQLTTTLGRKVKVVADNRTLLGRAVGLDASGCLVVEDETGHRQQVQVGDVHHLAEAD
jgi:BirA family biotin operon repressor/biotin-[acetyl-CoA-carboxylase] ligase